MTSALGLIEEHLAAFNAHDSDRLLATLAADVVWATGQDVCRGHDELAGMFDAGLWELDPSLTTQRMLADTTTVAAELIERITVDGEQREFHIAAFFTVDDGVIRSAKIYREGSADIE
jgi:ketosteroid isomerase-like protein